MSFRFLTAGESHGKALIGIVEGIPAGLEITEEYVHAQLRRRKLGYGRGYRQQIETDAVEILAGVRFAETMGSPIALLIWNKDWSAWQDIMHPNPRAKGAGPVRRTVDVPRPGHADLVGGIKYAHKDMRNVLERSSARETAMRVAAGSVARRFLEALGVDIASRVTRIGAGVDKSELDLARVSVARLNEKTDRSPVRASGAAGERAMIQEIELAKKRGDTLGGVIEVIASGVPLGLGSYAQWDRRLEGDLGKAFLSLNAIKGVQVGLGFGTAEIPGSLVHDEYFPAKRGKKTAISYRSNRSGGIDGGMATGQPIVIRAAMKPLATLMKPLRSVDLADGKATKAHVERSDVCAVPAAAVIGESLMALVLAQHMLEKFGGDSMKEILPRVREWKSVVG